MTLFLIRPYRLFTAAGFRLKFVTFCLKFTIRTNSRKFSTEFHGNSEIPGNYQREFRVAWIPGIPGISRMGIPGGTGGDLKLSAVILIIAYLFKGLNRPIFLENEQRWWLYDIKFHEHSSYRETCKVNPNLILGLQLISRPSHQFLEKLAESAPSASDPRRLLGRGYSLTV